MNKADLMMLFLGGLFFLLCAVPISSLHVIKMKELNVQQLQIEKDKSCNDK